MPSCRRTCTTSRSPSATFKLDLAGCRCRVSEDVGLDAGSLHYPAVYLSILWPVVLHFSSVMLETVFSLACPYHVMSITVPCPAI